MSITSSSNRLIALATGVAVALALMGAAAVAPAQAAGLTQTQIQSIVSLLASFGADQATINNVTAALNGQATTGTGGSTGSTGGACPALTRDLQQGSSGADVKALQVFLNGNASTQVAASGAGSPGNETMTFGPATKAAVIKFQTAHSVTPAAGYVGAKTRAAIAATCGGTSSTGGSTGGTTTGGAVSVMAGNQPANSLAPQGASRVPFTTFSLSNTTGSPVTINSVTVQRTGLGVDANFSGIVLLDSNGLQIGISKTLNSNHQANIGDVGFTIPANSTASFTVAGNIASGQSTNGQVVSLQVVAVNTGATVSGALPITGASQTINNTLTIGSVSTSTSSFDPGAAQTKNIGDTGVRFSGIKFTAGSTEDLKLFSVRWRQVGTASGADISNVVTIVNGTSYPATIDASGKYYTTTFPGGLLITKGNSVDVYVQGDITGSNAASRTVEMDIDKVTDVYFVGQLYGYGVTPSGSYQPWFKGNTATINAGTLTTISKANNNQGAAQNVAVNVNNQAMGGFTTNFSGEPVSVSGMTFTIATSSLTTSSCGGSTFTSVSVVNSNGQVVAGPVDATTAASGETLTYTDTVTFPTGVQSYYLQGKIPSCVTGGSFSLNTTPGNWTSPTGQTSGNSISLSGAGTVTMNSMTIKPGALTVSLSTTPSSQNIVSGVSGFNFANVLLDASQSGEDVRLASMPINETGFQNNLSACQAFNGTTALTTGANVLKTISGTAKNVFTFDNPLTVPKGTIKTIAINCNLSGSATSSSTYQFTNDTTSGDWAPTGVTSGISITPTLTVSSGGTMTVQTASMTLTVDSSSPASTTLSGGSTGQTVAVYNVIGNNDTINLTKLGMTLNGKANSSDVTTVWVYNGSTLLGSAVFGAGQTTATSTFTGGGGPNGALVMTPNTNYKLTVKADVADIGTGKPGTEGDVIAIDPNSAEGIGSSGTVDTSSTNTTNGARVYNSFPTFTTSGGGNGNLTNGAQQLLSLTVGADAAGDIGLRELTFTISTTTVSVTVPTFTGPNGSVASSSLAFDFGGATTLLHVYFDSASNTSDATVGAGTSKTYALGGTVSGLTTTGGVVSIALKTDGTASTTMNTAASFTNGSSRSNDVWSPLATTTLDKNTNDWTNAYALTKGCFATAGFGNDCQAVTTSK